MPKQHIHLVRRREASHNHAAGSTYHDTELLALGENQSTIQIALGAQQLEHGTECLFVNVQTARAQRISGPGLDTGRH